MLLTKIRKELRTYASPKKAAIARRFFKTGPGEYGEGDIFIGVKVPELRLVARAFEVLPLNENIQLLASPIHEERFLALLILIRKYEGGDLVLKKMIVDLYLKHTRHINNWDLIDVSSHKIIGNWLKGKERKLLTKLARSRNMWERRIAIVSTYAFIRENDLMDTFCIADILINDGEDLLHKATGWMLREAGKRDRLALEIFLNPRYETMPRTMLRYAIEQFPEAKRKKYLFGKKV